MNALRSLIGSLALCSFYFLSPPADYVPYRYPHPLAADAPR